MEKDRRPAAGSKPGERREVEGFIPIETNTYADKTTQPYRHAVIDRSRLRSTPLQRGTSYSRTMDIPARRPSAVAAQATAVAEPQARPSLPQRLQAKKRRVRLDMSLPNGESLNRHHMVPKIRRSMRRARLLFIRSAFAGAALIFIVGGILISQGFFSLHKVFKGTAVQAAALTQNVDPNQLKGEGDGRINVLLTGIGGPDHDGGDLTDTLMVASIDPVNNKAALLSVPRDLWVTLPGKGSMKINAAYETAKYAYMHKNKVDGNNSQAIEAGFTSIDQTLEQVLGVPIHYNLLLNFHAFQQAVDTVGGITVDVPSDLYDPTMSWENNHSPYIARAGTQVMDGKHALLYVRSRETSSDFARSQRQRAVILALKQKVATLGTLANPAKIAGLVNTFGDNVQTDLSLTDASHLYGIIKKINNNDIQSISLAGTTTIDSAAAGTDSLVTTGNINGQSIVMPKAGLEDYSAIQQFVRSKLQDGYLTKEHAKVLIVNATGQDGLAGQASALLKSYGYNVIGTATAPELSPTTTVVDLSHGKDRYTKHYLEDRFTTTAVTKLPDATINTQNADFVVLLGGDENGLN